VNRFTHCRKVAKRTCNICLTKILARAHILGYLGYILKRVGFLKYNQLCRIYRKLRENHRRKMHIIIIIISPPQSIAGHRPLQLLAISLDLRLKMHIGTVNLFITCLLRIITKSNSEQIPYEKCHYFEITWCIFKIRIISEVSYWLLLLIGLNLDW
jgi:hypothetical protein